MLKRILSYAVAVLVIISLTSCTLFDSETEQFDTIPVPDELLSSNSVEITITDDVVNYASVSEVETDAVSKDEPTADSQPAVSTTHPSEIDVPTYSEQVTSTTTSAMVIDEDLPISYQDSFWFMCKSLVEKGYALEFFGKFSDGTAITETSLVNKLGRNYTSSTDGTKIPEVSANYPYFRIKLPAGFVHSDADDFGFMTTSGGYDKYGIHLPASVVEVMDVDAYIVCCGAWDAGGSFHVLPLAYSLDAENYTMIQESLTALYSVG